jgi:hypothetical protein
MKENSIITLSSTNLISSYILNLKIGYNYFSKNELGFNGSVKKGFLPRIRISLATSYFHLSTKIFSKNYQDYFGSITGSTYKFIRPFEFNQSWSLNAKFIMQKEYLSHSIKKSYSLFNSFRLTANVTNETTSTIVTIQNSNFFLALSIIPKLILH